MRNKKILFAALCVALSLSGISSVEAKQRTEIKAQKKAARVEKETPSVPSSPAHIVTAMGVAPLETPAKHVFLLDATTNTPLMEKDADVKMPTSSMSKVLTMYLVFEALKTGKMALTDEVTISPQAWKQEGSRMFVQVGSRVKVEDLVRGVIIQSGNDAAVALAEAVGGTEGNFASLMNQKAQALGMTQSHFMNATGLPDPDHYSTARDLAVLAQAMIRDFPEHYKYYAELEFSYGGIRQGNRNPLLYRGIGADGMKTGHTTAAGYGLIGTSSREGRRLIMVVNGLDSMQARADEGVKILDWGYREYGVFSVLTSGAQLAEADVFLGVQKTVPLWATKSVVLTLPYAAKQSLQTKVLFEHPLPAPVAKGSVVGKAVVTAQGIDPIEVPLVTSQDVAQVGFWERFVYKVKHLMGKA